MALQGILCGFADPANLAANVILVGRGDNYVLLVDGKPARLDEDIAIARKAFRETADTHCRPHWLSVSELCTDSVTGAATVRATEQLTATYAERYPAHDDDGDDKSNAA